MYFKLVSNGTSFGGPNNTNYASYRRYVLEDLRGVIMGSITSTSGLNTTVHNTSSSVITGTRPSTGIYHETGCNRNTSSSATSDDYFIQFYKRHHGYLQDNTNADMQRAVHIRSEGTYSLFPRMGTDVTNSVTGINNDFPNSLNGWLDAGSTYDPSAGYTTPYYWHSLEGILNDKVFVLKLNMSPLGSSYSDMIFIMADQEYQANYDNHTRAQFQYHCPTVAIYHSEFNLESNNTVGSTSTSGKRAGNNIGKVQRFGRYYPTGNNSSDSYTSSYIMGQYSTNTTYDSYNSLFPPPWYEILGRTPVANGNAGFVMQPLLYVPHIGLPVTANYYHSDYKEFSRLMGIWRTGDDTFYSGERVTDGDGNAYRAFRAYKVGSPTSSDTGYTYSWGYSQEHSRSAVYLFPEAGT